jgi:hypothetical protein
MISKYIDPKQWSRTIEFNRPVEEFISKKLDELAADLGKLLAENADPESPEGKAISEIGGHWTVLNRG